MADYQTAYILSLVGGIIVLIGGLVTLGAAGVVGAFLPLFTGAVLAAGIVGLVVGIVIIWGATMMKQKGKQRTGSILVLVFSIISLFVGGGFFIGFILALIGAIIGLTQK